ncbi:hypothetical protein, partial [Burkholderia ambifaria]|uniref:hypothetical protein n=1 Tax=Burkholderia ambifaria TaxID=152480 RepID=UPI0012FD00EB
GVTDNQGRTTTSLTGGDSTENLTVTASAESSATQRVSGSTTLHYLADETIGGIGIHAISGFRIEAVKGGAPGSSAGPLVASIYGNGRHQIEILIRLDIHGSDGRMITGLDAKKLYDHLYLVDHATGKNLDWFYSLDQVKNAKHNYVFYAREKGEYCPVAEIDTLKADGTGSYYVPFYVSISGTVAATQVVARLSFDKVGHWIESSGRRSSTTTALPNDSVSFATITCLDPLDYSNEKNLQISGRWTDWSDLKSVSKSLHRYHESDAHLGHNDYDGECYTGTLNISPSQYGLKFLSCELYSADSSQRLVPGKMPAYDGKNIAGVGADIYYSHKTPTGYGNAFVFIQKETYGLENGFAILYEDAHGVRDDCTLHINDTNNTRFSWAEPLPRNGDVRVNYCNYWVYSWASENQRG